MCFGTHKNNQYVGEYGPLPKSVNNSKGLNFESILGDIYDVAKSGFNRVASLELGLWEAEKLAELRDVEENAKISKTQSYAGNNWNNPNQSMFEGNNIMIIAGAGLAALLVVLMAKELK